MIADLINDTYKVRLITKNVMSVFSSSKSDLDEFLTLLHSSNYIVNGLVKSADNILCYKLPNINKFECVYHILEKHTSNLSKSIEYISYLGLNHILWIKWHHLSDSDLLAVSTVIRLMSERKIILIDCIESHQLRDKLYSIAYNIGIADKLVIIPYTSVFEAVNNSTCQCYFKHDFGAKIISKFSNEFLNKEFNTSVNYYHTSKPKVYCNTSAVLAPTSYKYSAYDLILIYLYSIKILFLNLITHWRFINNVS